MYGVEQYYSVIDTVTSMVKQAGAAVVFSGPYQILKSVMKSADRYREFSKNVYPLIGRCCLSLLCLAADRPEPRTLITFTVTSISSPGMRQSKKVVSQDETAAWAKKLMALLSRTGVADVRYSSTNCAGSKHT